PTDILFNNINLTINKPGIYMVLGKNGAGKSSFFRILQGGQEPGYLSGTIVINNKHYNLTQSHDREKLYNNIVSLDQNYDQLMVPGFTGEELLRLKNMAKHPFFLPLPKAINKNLALEFGIPLDKPV